MAEQIQGVPADVTEDELPVQGVPAGLTEETLPKASVSAKSKVEGVPEGVTEEDLPNLQQKDAETLHNAWEGAKHYAGGLASSLEYPHLEKNSKQQKKNTTSLNTQSRWLGKCLAVLLCKLENNCMAWENVSCKV